MQGLLISLKQGSSKEASHLIIGWENNTSTAYSGRHSGKNGQSKFL